MSGKKQTIKELKAQIETILEEKPELRPFQDEIDRLMSKIFDPVARLQVLSFMICGNIMKMQDLLATLSPLLSDMAQVYSNAAPESTNLTPDRHAWSCRTLEGV